MTRQFNVQYTCKHCGNQSDAQTAFGRWMRDNKALDSVNGIVRTDTDHIICRYMTSLDGRDFQLLMIVEVKEWGKGPRDDQIDVLSFIRQLAERTGVNRHDAKTRATHKLFSKRNGRYVNVRWYGVHLLQFQRTCPKDGWIKWNDRVISEQKLEGILAMHWNPYHPDRPILEMLRDRHNHTTQPELLPCSPTAK